MSNVVHHHHHHRGIGIGVVIAAILSWTTHHSVFWCIINAIFGWLYVIYWLIFYW